MWVQKNPLHCSERDLYVCYVVIYLIYICTTARFTSFVEVKVIIESVKEVTIVAHLFAICAAKLYFFFHSAKKKDNYFAFLAAKCFNEIRAAGKMSV